MKLFTKYSRISAGFTILIFSIASMAFYYTLNYVQLQQIEADLQIEEDEIKLYVMNYDRMPPMVSVEDQLIHFTPTAEIVNRHFREEVLKDQSGRWEKFRQLIFPISIAGQQYEVAVSKSLQETDHLVRTTLWVTLATILIILIVFVLINRYVLKELWKPFYQALDAMKGFTLQKDQPLGLAPTGTDEFSLLNRSISDLTQRAKFDYLSLKTFSENASHEIQTPIAIIRSKIELLAQDEYLTERQSGTLQAIAESVHRLSTLNSSLLLLAKIENRQFQEAREIDLEEVLQQKIADFQELWEMYRISLTVSMEKAFISMNPELLDILLNNLFANATKHNRQQGMIAVELRPGLLKVSNTSNQGKLNTERLYERFYKASPSRENNGLGLSIIRTIADASGITLSYDYADNRHEFLLRWGT